MEESRARPTRSVTDVSPNLSDRPRACRRQQQRRGCARIGHRRDLGVSDGARPRVARAFQFQQIPNTQASGVERGARIAIPIVPTRLTPPPAAPRDRLSPIFWRALRLGRRATVWTGVRGAPWRTGLKTQAHQLALVSQEPPDLTADGGIIAPVAPAPAHTPSASGRLQRLQGLHREERAIMHLCQQQEHGTRQVGERLRCSYVCQLRSISRR